MQKRAESFGVKLFSFGKNPESDYRIESSKIKAVDRSEILLKNKNTEISYAISTASKTAIFNSSIVAACLDLLTNRAETGLAALTKLEDTAGRGKAFEIDYEGKKITIIDDSYNASVLSMHAGLE